MTEVPGAQGEAVAHTDFLVFPGIFPSECPWRGTVGWDPLTHPTVNSGVARAHLYHVFIFLLHLLRNLSLIMISVSLSKLSFHRGSLKRFNLGSLPSQGSHFLDWDRKSDGAPIFRIFYFWDSSKYLDTGFAPESSQSIYSANSCSHGQWSSFTHYLHEILSLPKEPKGQELKKPLTFSHQFLAQKTGEVFRWHLEVKEAEDQSILSSRWACLWNDQQFRDTHSKHLI